MAETAVATHAPEPMSDEETLSYTQGVRRKLVDSIAENGVMPAENKDRLTLLATLDGMDRAALAVKKIESKEKTSSADRDAQLVIASLNAKLGATNPFKQDASNNEPALIEGELVDAAGPVFDDSQMPALDIKPGEMDVGIHQENAEAFLDRFEAGQSPQKT